MGKKLKDKKILLLMPQFYGYEKYILSELEKKELNIDVFYTNLIKYDYRYRFLKMMPLYITSEYYVRSFESKIKEKDYDIVFMIAEASMKRDFIVKVLKKYQNAKSVLYLWDSIQNCPNVLGYYALFDYIYTFDYKDSVDNGWKYRPLFYIEDLVGTHIPIFDISIICTAYPERICFVNELKEYAYDKNIKIHDYLYAPMSYFIKNRLQKEQSGKKSAKINFLPLSLEKTYEVYNNSFAVIDLASNTQSGLTMRTIECLGNGCKLITNNRSVLRADFYDSNNIYYFENNLKDIPIDFFEKNYKKISTPILNKYSISQWLNEILELEIYM